MSEFDQAREAFSLLAHALRTEEDLRSDVERAFEFLLARFNTRIYENRFIVGGVTERIISAAFVALGQRATNCGVRVTRTDIAVGDTSISIKGVFKPGHREVRVVNVMGDSTDARWNEPTPTLAGTNRQFLCSLESALDMPTRITRRKQQSGQRTRLSFP